jgi:hypothetical protein
MDPIRVIWVEGNEMREGRRIRIIRKIKPAAENAALPEDAVAATNQPSEREIKTVVSRWVREHRQRSEEFRLTFTALLKGGGFSLPSR